MTDTSAPRLSPIRRRIVFALLFEAIGFVCSSLILMGFASAEASTATGAAAGSMIIALLYNYVFNAGFEAWERRQSVKGRSWKRRLAHGGLFELGLVVLMVPFLAWWMQVSLLDALIYDAVLLVFFALYTLGFTWAFDRLFGLPESAR
ncbi:PACE efflux transporter [Xinfangfangia sp. CPCC 101601]|uniref:PACE efflux transporter n=1 Tax=Pseudogemmobacter lacusdianii TaxID=3069608 RepID=A0ABU0W118_9RHOB|nr:PACE efflux transporter [Xinfangfangia sp. CPCC 101601]MDQ2067715.1 PACE efflux transporter [Xinfangfangia sp. CPCC 101601]